jgi:hypothetical protein
MYFAALLCSASVSFVRCLGAGSAGGVFLVTGCYSSRDKARKEYEAKLLKYRSGELANPLREPSGRVGFGTKICKAIRQVGRSTSDPRFLVFGVGRGDSNNSLSHMPISLRFPHVGFGEGERSHASSTQTRVAGCLDTHDALSPGAPPCTSGLSSGPP